MNTNGPFFVFLGGGFAANKKDVRILADDIRGAHTSVPTNT